MFKAVLDFGEEGRGHIQRLISAELAFSPPPCTHEKEGEDNTKHRESPGSATALWKSEFLSVGSRDSKKWIIPLKLLESTGIFLSLVCNSQAGCSGGVDRSSMTVLVLSETCQEQQAET